MHCASLAAASRTQGPAQRGLHPDAPAEANAVALRCPLWRQPVATLQWAPAYEVIAWAVR